MYINTTKKLIHFSQPKTNKWISKNKDKEDLY